MANIKEEQLTKIQDQQKALTDILNQVGVLEAQKHGLLHEFAHINKQVEDTKKELEDEYGQVSINLQTGEYTEVPKDE
jgi:vacuolar-type H+-ATPase subunit D/Vma8